MQNKNKKIAIFFPYFSLGGGEVVAAWMIEALKEDYDVTLFTCDAVTANMLNKMYDTHLTEKDFNVINPPMSFLLRKISILGLIKYHVLVRYYKLLNKKFDALIGAWNVIDFGEKGIQYIDSIEYNFNKYNLKPFRVPKLYQYAPFLKNFYKTLYSMVSGYREESMKKNLTLVISLWTKDIIQDTLGIDSMVVYPPVEGKFPKIDWEKRENGFVCLGRISSEKEIEKVIEILGEARKNNSDVHLHIIGGAKDLIYGEFIKNLCDKNKDWCFLEGEIYGLKKAEFIAKHKFGISGRVDEFFGIATAEMAKAGCIVFVPNSGGQVEIVDNSQLIYENEKDAVEKISKVLNDKNIQIELQKHLLENNKKFSTENFKKEIKKIVENFISQKNS
jgi:glycosyltransferase involved in cell wall biosynthesis